MNNRISIPNINYIKQICQDLKACDSISKAKILTEAIVSAYPLLNFDIRTDQEFRFLRSRKCGKIGFSKLNEILSPPHNLVQAGRLNSANNPILYASKNAWATYDEIGAEKGDFVQSAILKIKASSLKVCTIGEYKNAQRWGSSSYPNLTAELSKFAINLAQSNQDAFKSIIYLDSFLSSVLTDRNAKKNGYLATQHLAEAIFKKHPDIDGIFYKGVESGEALNIAIQEEKSSNLIEVDDLFVCEIIDNHGHGIFDTKIIKK